MIKNIFSLLVLTVFCFQSCKTKDNNPKEVLSSFIEAISKQDYSKAKELATEDSKNMLGLMAMTSGFLKDKQELPKFDEKNLEYGPVNIEGNEANIDVKDKKSGFSTKYFLKNENGWKVSFTMNSAIKGINNIKSDKQQIPEELKKELEKLKDINMDSLAGVMTENVKNLSHSQKDSIDRQIKEALKNVKPVPPDSIWSEMEKKLKTLDSARKVKKPA